jgi:type IV secretory pathway VirB10-like protein
MKKSICLGVALIFALTFSALAQDEKKKEEPKAPAAKVTKKAAPKVVPIAKPKPRPKVIAKKADPAPKAAPKEEPKPKPKAEPVPTEKPKEETKPKDEEEKPAAAPVETKEEQKWWEYGLSELMKLGFLLLTLMATAFVRVLMKKYGFEEQSAKLNDLLMKAVGYAEQKAIKASQLEEGKKTSGAEKMALAVEFAQGLAKEYSLPEKGQDWWEDHLESWLGVSNGHSEE